MSETIEQTKRIYAGIGSRQTPESVLVQMRDAARHLASAGWVLRSGGAEGADTAFEHGCDSVCGEKEIFLPWRGFNGNRSRLCTAPPEAFHLAARTHPAWDRCSLGARKLHARNVLQVLGMDLSSPVEMVLCWTKGGGDVGGTATAIRLAREHGAKVFNFANQADWWGDFLPLIS